jgi:PAS domain S-box-containing protein
MIQTVAESDISPLLRVAVDAHGRGANELLQALPVAIYMTDAAGHITFYNEAAAELWGNRPEIGKSEFCGSWKLYWPDGRPLPHAECPMAVSLREKRPIRGVEAVAERPDGTRVPFVPYPTPLFDAEGKLIGAVNMLMDISERQSNERAARHLAAIVESSEDAILAKDLNGIITSWNQGAQRLFGYTAEEIIGKPVTVLIPAERQDEEPAILARLRRGERIDHYETIRQRKDGSRIDISLSVSPIRGANGEILGASKIARDITERRRSQEQQRLLLREMDHRIKNLFALATSVVTLSARGATSPEGLASAVRERLGALARAHALTLPHGEDHGHGAEKTTLHALLRTIVLPYESGTREDGSRISIEGCDAEISGAAVTSFALLLHEFATNAAKYGAFSTPGGRIAIACSEEAGQFVLTWSESGGPSVEPQSGDNGGFGSLLTRVTVKGQFNGEITRDWQQDGLVIRLAIPRERLGS